MTRKEIEEERKQFPNLIECKDEIKEYIAKIIASLTFDENRKTLKEGLATMYISGFLLELNTLMEKGKFNSYFERELIDRGCDYVNKKWGGKK